MASKTGIRSDGSSAIFSFSASDAFNQHRNEETQEVRDLKEKFGPADVDSVVPKDLRSKIWSPQQRETFLTILREKTIHPEEVRYALTPEMERDGVGLKERVAFLAKILTVQRLLKHREQLIETIGPDDYQFLVGFLERARTISLHNRPIDSFEGLQLLDDVSKHSDRFAALAGRVLTHLETLEVRRNRKEWARFEHAGEIPFKSRIEFAKQQEERLKLADQFWTQLKKALPPEFSQEEVQTVVKQYFSRFDSGIVAAEPKDLAEIQTILARRKAGQQIAKQCLPLLRLDSIDGVNQPIHDLTVVSKAEKAQLAFDIHLEKIKRLDFYHLLSHAAEQQQSLFEILLALPVDRIPAFKDALVPEDQQIVQELLDKQSKTNQPLRQLVEQALASSRAKVPGYKKELSNEIQQLQKELDHEARIRGLNPGNDLISPEGAALRTLLATTKDLNSQNVLVGLRERAAEIREQRRQGDTLSAEVLTQLANEERELNAQIEELERRPLDPEQRERSFFDDFYVLPVGNVVYHTEDKKMDGKWIVVDLREVKDDQDKETILRQLTPEFLKAQIVGKVPYETVSYDEKLTRLPHRRGPVKIFYEDAITVRKSQQDLDIGQRSRLVRLVPDPKHPIKKEDELNYARVKESIPEAESAEVDPWDINAKRTAAVGQAQAIWTSRLLLADILSGKTHEIEPNAYRGIGIYLDAVQGSDLSKLPGSFLEQPNFLQAINDYGAASETVTKLFNERLHATGLKLSEDKRNYKLAEAGVRLMEIYSTFKKWNASIDKFFKLMPRTLKDDFASYSEEFRRIQIALKMFIDGFPADVAELYDRKPKEQNFFPTALITEYAQKKGNAALEKLIRSSLVGNGPGQDLGHRFHSIFPTLLKLAQIQTSPALSARHREIMDKVDRESRKGLEFAQAVDIALGNCFQGAPRVEMPLAEMAIAVSEFSELNVVVRKAWTVMKQATLSLEELRSKENRQLLQSAVGRNTRMTVRTFFDSRTKKRNSPARRQIPG